MRERFLLTSKRSTGQEKRTPHNFPEIRGRIASKKRGTIVE